MCGIAGLYDPSLALRTVRSGADIVRDMTRSLAHRGPDADGIWVDKQQRCTLGHRRLSVIDTSNAGKQPMGDATGRWVITFNGEIYNFQDVRQELQANSVALKGRTDTEVLLESIALWGERALPKFDGMYAFAAYDTLTGEMLLGRDPFGEKPLYYMELPEGGLAFASELQALEIVPGFDPTVSIDALAEVLMFQYVGAPRSIYQRVQKLPPGHWMRLVPGRAPEIRRFFEFRPGADGYAGSSMAQLADELEDILVRSLGRRLVADVPLGAFLSGGVDSSTVCALARRKLGFPLTTFSIGFSGDKESEHEIARKFAEHLGTQHHDKIIAPSAVDFLNHAGALLDEPNADSSCLPTYYLSEFARQHVTVAVSGDGGDELFGGYGRYFETLKEERSSQQRLDPAWSAGRSYYHSNRIMLFSPAQLEQLFGFIPSGAWDHVGRLVAELDDEAMSLLHRLRKSDLENYMPGAVLPKVDRMSMRHSLEVRTPFLNMELARFAEKVPAHYLVGGGRGKLLLREVAYRYLPRELIDMPKKGFGLPMVGDWGKSQLVSALRDCLANDSPLGDWLGAERAQRFINSQSSANGFSTYQTWSVIMLDRWLRGRPAKLPEVDKQAVVTPTARLASTNGGRPMRSMGFVAPSVIVVSSPRFGRQDDHLAFEQQLSTLDYAVLRGLGEHEGLERARPASTDAPESYRLEAEWDIARCLRETGIDVAGCTLISLDSNDQWITLSDIEFLRAQRVRRLLVPARHQSSQVWIRYTFTHASKAQRAINILRLLPHACAVWQFKDRGRERGGEHKTERFPGLATQQNTESSLDYALFEGPSQFLPYVSSHQEIAESTGRQYSVWNGSVYYSLPLSRRTRALAPLYSAGWIVPVNKETVPLLPAASQQVRIGDGACGDSLKAAINQLVDVTNAAQRGSGEPGFVILYTHGLPAGGAERQWCNLAIGLKQLGKRVCLVVENHAGVNGHYLDMVRGAGVEVLQTVDEREFKLSSSPVADLFPLFVPSILPSAVSMSKLAALLARLRPDALVAQLDVTNITGAIAALLTNVPNIALSFRNYSPIHFDYLNQPWLLPAYQALLRSNRVTLTGNSLLGNLDYAKWVGMDPARIHLLKNAYQPDAVQPLSALEKEAFRRSLEINSEAKIVFGAFRLSREKNPQLFVNTCVQVLGRNPNAVALLCGEGPMHAELEESVAAAGLSHRLRLLGRRSDVWKFLRISDVLLLTSDKEGTPNIVREALMAHCPVVSTACGAVPEMIQDGVNGHLAPVDDMQALAMSVEKVLFDERHRAQLVERIAADCSPFTPRDKANLLLRILQRESAQDFPERSEERQMTPSRLHA